MKTSIHYSEEICKRLEAKKLTETISPYAMEYINTIMLAVDKYQIRSANGIKHFWLIASLAYMIACFESKRYNFSEGYHLLSQTIRREQISFIFDYAQNGGDKSALLENIASPLLCIFTKTVLGCSFIVFHIDFPSHLLFFLYFTILFLF